MCSLRGDRARSDLAQEPEELLVPVPRVAGAGNLAGGGLQRGERRGGAVPDVVAAALFRDPGRMGINGAFRSSAWASSCALEDLKLSARRKAPAGPPAS
jgi:hypothetical protein